MRKTRHNVSFFLESSRMVKRLQEIRSGIPFELNF